MKYFFILLFLFVIAFTQCKKEEDKDTNPPSITLKGANPFYVAKDSTFIEPGYIAMDEEEGDITEKVTFSDNINTSFIGDYERIYKVKDEAGNIAEEKTRKIKVLIF